MSTIHKALRKAQQSKGAGFHEYDGVLSSQRQMKDRILGSAFWWIPIGVIVGGVAFASYIWFDSNDPLRNSMESTQNNKPEQALIGNNPAAEPIHIVPPISNIQEKGPVVMDVKMLYERARSFHQNGRLITAKRLYQEILRIVPAHVDALNNLGVIYMHDKNYEAARSSFEKAIRVRPEHVDPHYNLACLNAIKGQNGQAVAYLKKAYRLDPGVGRWARVDADLKNLKGIPEFEAIIRAD